MTSTNEVIFGDRPIHIAARRGQVPDLRALIGAGADINVQGNHDFTPLHNAVLHDWTDAVQFRLEMGVDQGITNDDGATAFELVRIMGHADIVTLLERDRGVR